MSTIPPAQYVGPIPVRQTITVLSGDDPCSISEFNWNEKVLLITTLIKNGS